MKRALIIAAVLVIALLFSTTAMAQEACSETEQAFSIPESFPLNGDAWIVTYGAEVAEPDPESDFDDDGFRMHTNVDAGGDHNVVFRLHFDSPVTISDISADITAEEGGALIAFGFCILEECDPEDFSTVNSGIQSAPYTFEHTTEETGVYELFVALGCSGTGSDCELDNLVLHGVVDACLFRTVHDTDLIEETDPDNDQSWLLTTTAGARVFAIDDATVQAVYHDSTGYRVTLLINGATPVQYSNLAIAFADTGDVIEGGCVIGYAGVPPPGVVEGSSYLVYQHDLDLGDWHDYNESLSNTPCDAESSDCLNANPEFNDDGSSWLSRYAIADALNTGEDSAMLLPEGGELYQSGFTLDDSTSYYVTVAVTIVGAPTASQITVGLPQVPMRLNVNTSGGRYVVLESPAFSPPADGANYEFILDNYYPNPTTLKVTFACLHSNEVEAQLPRCYFDDAIFEEDSFETEGGATHETDFGGNGMYSIPAGGSIRAPVEIAAYIDDDKDFTLAIVGSAPDGASELTASIVDSGDDTELAAIGAYNFLYPLWSTPITRTFTLGDGETLDGDLLIENTGDETVLVGSVCLAAVDGVWVGHENPELADHNLLEPNCEQVCPFPTSVIDVVAWLNWLGCNIDYLIRCLLYGLINDIWNTALAVVSGLGLLGRWLGRSITVVVGWAWQAAGRLLAGIASSIIPIVNAVLAWLYGLPFFRSILDAFSIAGMWLDAIFSLLASIFSLFGSVLILLGAVANMIGNLWNAFFVAVNDASASYSVLINCADTGDPLYLTCLGLETVNFFVSRIFMISVLGTVVAAVIGWRQIQAAFEEFEEAGAMLG